MLRAPAPCMTPRAGKPQVRPGLSDASRVIMPRRVVPVTGGGHHTNRRSNLRQARRADQHVAHRTGTGRWGHGEGGTIDTQASLQDDTSNERQLEPCDAELRRYSQRRYAASRLSGSRGLCGTRGVHAVAGLQTSPISTRWTRTALRYTAQPTNPSSSYSRWWASTCMSITASPGVRFSACTRSSPIDGRSGRFSSFRSTAACSPSSTWFSVLPGRSATPRSKIGRPRPGSLSHSIGRLLRTCSRPRA